MKKFFSTLLTIIFFQTQIFAFSIPIVPQIFFSAGKYDNSSLRTGLPVDATGAKVTLKEQGKEKEQLTKATIGKGTIIVGGQEQTEQDLSGLNRDTTKTQELTKDQITAALDADINVDIKLLTSLFDAAYNGDANKISVVKDYKKAKKEINEIKQKIQEKLQSKKKEIEVQRKQELNEQIKEQKFSLNEEQDKKIKEEIADNDEVLGLKRSIDNLKKVEDYVKENKIKDKKEIEKYKRLAVENVEIVRDKESGELYMITNYAREYTSEETTIGIGLERVSIKITAEVLNEARQGRAQDKLAEQITLAANAINESINKYSIQGLNYGLSAFSSDTDSSLPIAQIGFDILGIVPVVGVLGDYVSYKISEHYNDETGMFLSLVGMTDIYPQAVVAGTAGSVAKATKDIAKSAKTIEKLIKTISADGGKTAELAIKTAKKTEKLAKKVDFYVKPTGEVIPATGYRYIPPTDPLLPNIQKNMIVPIRDKPTYFSFDKFDIPSPNKLQVPHDASIRLEFNTLQIIDDIKIPYGRWGTESYLEPIVKDYFIYGNGGATQAITNRSFKINSIIDLNKSNRGTIK